MSTHIPTNISKIWNLPPNLEDKVLESKHNTDSVQSADEECDLQHYIGSDQSADGETDNHVSEYKYVATMERLGLNGELLLQLKMFSEIFQWTNFLEKSMLSKLISLKLDRIL